MAAFVDTNVLIYAYVSSAANVPEKSRKAKTLLAELMLKETLTVSAQVLSEFSANAIKKGAPPLTIE